MSCVCRVALYRCYEYTVLIYKIMHSSTKKYIALITCMLCVGMVLPRMVLADAPTASDTTAMSLTTTDAVADADNGAPEVRVHRPLPAAVAAHDITILALGDSYTAGYGLTDDQKYPTRLEDMLRARGYSVHVENAGISGATAQDIADQLTDLLANERYDIAIIAAGANDMEENLPIAQTETALRSMLDALHESGVQPVLCGMLANAQASDAYRDAFDALYPELATEYTLPLVPSLMEGVAGQPEYIQADHEHPNAVGALLLARNVFPEVQQAVETVRQERHVVTPELWI